MRGNFKTTKLAEIFKARPVDITARLVTGPGEHYEPPASAPDPTPAPAFVIVRKHAGAMNVQKEHSDIPHLILEPKLQGYKFGRFTVMGICKRGGSKHARYSCRCRCGAYEVRTHRAIFNYPANRNDCCMVCDRSRGPETEKSSACNRFWMWLEKQQTRNDYIGDLSREAKAETQQRQELPDHYLNRHNHIDDDTKAAIDLAFEEYRKELRIEKPPMPPRPAPAPQPVGHSTTSGAYFRKLRKHNTKAPEGRLWYESTASIRTLRNPG